MGRTIALTQTTTKTVPRPRLAPHEELFGEGDCQITCRVCGGMEQVFIDHPALLCGACLQDISATVQRVAADYASAMVAFFEAEKALRERAKEDNWYAKTEQARGDMSVSPATFARAWEAARLEGGEKAALVGLRDAMDLAAETMQVAERRCIAAAPELAAARAAMGEPVEV